MGETETVVCDQCSKTVGNSEKRYGESAPDDTYQVFCESCWGSRITRANDLTLAYKDAAISVTFQAGGVPMGA